MSRRTCRASLVAVLLLGLSNTALAQSWPQHQRDAARTGYQPEADLPPPFAVTWRWHPENPSTSVSGRVQPVVADGTVCVGYYDGTLYALDAATGAEMWQHAGSGAITASAAIDDGRVFYGSSSGAVYGVDLADGATLWTANADGPVLTAPCVAEGRVYVGSTDGRLYALNAATGVVVWIYESGAPILTTPAYADGRVFAGNEALHAFAVDAEDGTQVWRERLHGQTISVYHPVVASGAGVVFYRTGPFDVFLPLLGAGDQLLEQAGSSGWNAGDGTEQQRADELARIRRHIDERPDLRRTFWPLATTDGLQRYTAPVLYTAGAGAVPTPPVVDEAGARAWVIWRSLYARWDSGTAVQEYGGEPGAMDLSTGDIRHFSTEARASLQRGRFHVAADETSALSASGKQLFIATRGTLGGLDLETEDAFHVLASELQSDYANGGPPYAYGGDWPDGSVTAGGGSGGGYAAPAAIAEGGLFWIARWGLVVRADSAVR